MHEHQKKIANLLQSEYIDSKCVCSQAAGEAMIEKMTTELQASKESNTNLQRELTSLQVRLMQLYMYINSVNNNQLHVCMIRYLKG